MAQSKIIVGLEIGTTKTCMIVVENRPDTSATIIGCGEVRSAGVRAGEIRDTSMAGKCVSDAWQAAQDHSDVDIVSVYLSVTGDHIYGESNRGSYRLPDNESIIEENHINYAREKAENLEVPQDHYVMHRELGGFSIDGGEPGCHPAGLSGRTLDVDCHIIHGIQTRLQNSLLCVRNVPLEVEDLVFAPLATAQRVLTPYHKKTGAIVIDIGGGTTDYICYMEGSIVASGCIPVGGVNINQDIVKLTGQRVSNKAAEFFKITEGNVSGDLKDRSMAVYKSDLGLHDASIARGELNRIIRNRLGDTLVRVRESLPKGVLEHQGMAVYFSGGTSLMRGLKGLAEQIFKVPAHLPEPQSQDRKYSYLADPRFCTAIGLIRYAQRHGENYGASMRPNMLARFLNFLRRK